MNKMKTSVEIAKIANVSQTSVSLVLRDKWRGRVSPKVAEKILRIAEENNYRVNHMARMLRYGASENIALVVPDIENPFYSHILHNLNKITKERDYFCLLVETKTNSNWYTFIENAILSGVIEIAIVCYEDLPKRNPIIDKKLILINEYLIDLHCIRIDFYQAVTDAIRRFSEKPYVKIFHIRTHIEKPTLTLRQEAFIEACNKFGRPYETITLYSYSSNNLTEILESKKEYFQYPIAFLCDDDMLASGIYIFAQKYNIEVGKQIGIIGMDNIFLCNYFYPKLSSYGYDINILTREIVHMMDAIRDQKFKPLNITIDMTLDSSDSF